MPFGALNIQLSFMENVTDHPRGTPPAEGFTEGLNARGVAKYSDFGPIEGYIFKMVQNRR